MKKLFVMLLMLMLCVGIAVTANAAITPSQPSGDGTEGSPYLIGTAAELQWYADAVNSGNNNINGELTQNIDLNPGISFAFIPDTGLVEVTKNSSFVCYLGTGIPGDTSGNNSTFDATASTAGKVYASASSTTSSTEIPAELNLWKPIGNYNDSYAGNGVEYAFVGHFDGKGYTVSGVFSNKDSYSGLFGIMGNNTDSDCSIQDVNVANSYICSLGQRTGGILGSLTKGALTDCSSSALICAAGNAGGVVGSASSGTTIENCSFSGTLYSRLSNVAGICGYLTSGEIKDCYNTGSVISVSTANNTPVGGICGTSQGSSATVTAVITGCYNTGHVSAPGRQVGGIVGLNSIYATVNLCYNTGNVTGGSRVSGICGNSNGLSIGDCYNAGKVTASSEVGGICGFLNGDTITNSHNFGSITGTSSAGAICGSNNVSSTAITNTYYLEGTASKGVGNKTDTVGYAESKSAVDFKSNALVSKLNNGRTGMNAVWTSGKDYPVFGTPISTYTVTVSSTPAEGGTVTADKAEAAEGVTVTLTITPDDGYELNALTVKQGDTDVTVSGTGNTRTFTMPASEVTITATFKLAPQYITLNLESPRGLETTVQANINGTVADLKAVVTEKCGITFGEGSPYRLFGADLDYPNSRLDDDTKLLKDIGFAAEQTIHLEKDSTETWDASGNEAIKIFGLTITGGTGAQEPYGAYSTANYEWNYAHKTITIKNAPSSANITFSGTAEPGTMIVVRSSSWRYLTLDNVTMNKDGAACITVNASAKLDLTLKGTNTLTTGSMTEYGVEKKHPALELNQSSSQLRIKDGGNGTLIATSTCTGMPGIGTSGDDQSVGKITVNAGTIIANGGPGAPGLRSSSLYMQGGKLTANGGAGSTSDIYLYGTENKSIQIIKGTTPPVVVADVIVADVPGYVNINEGTEIGKITAPDVYFNVDTDTEVTSNAWYLLNKGTATNGTITIPDEGFTMNQPSNYGKAGETITITACPDERYAAETVKANDETLTGNADHQYSFTMPKKSVTVTAVFSSVTYTVTWVNENGELVDSETVTHGAAVTKSPAVPKKEGYAGAWNHNGQNITADTTIKPVYSVNSYTLTFKLENGEPDIVTENIPYGAAISAPAEPTKTNCAFFGWNRTIPDTMPAENVTITALWKIMPVIAFPTTAQTVTVREGETATMTITSENAVSYQWKVSDDGGKTWYDRGGNAPSYTTSVIKLDNDGYLYKCVVTSADGLTAESPIFTLNVLKMIELPQTGDNAQIGLWMALAMLSGCALLALRKRKAHN